VGLPTLRFAAFRQPHIASLCNCVCHVSILIMFKKIAAVIGFVVIIGAWEVPLAETLRDISSAPRNRTKKKSILKYRKDCILPPHKLTEMFRSQLRGQSPYFEGIDTPPIKSVANNMRLNGPE